MPRMTLLGKTFGSLTVLQYSHTNNAGNAFWKCQCLCGNISIVKAKYLNNGDTKSCGCLKKQHSDLYYLSTKFEKLQPIEKIVRDWKTYYKCLCNCGNSTVVLASNLLTGNTKSCGCLSLFTETDILNKKFGWLTPIELITPFTKCRCDCGKAVNVLTCDMVSGNTSSCGCKRKKDAEVRWSKKSYTKEHIVYLRRLVSSSDRIKVYKRDGFKCQICSMSNQLQVHHIVPVKEDSSVSSIFNLANSITLCRTCHFQIAHGKTTKDLNKNIQQFLQWRVYRNIDK